MICCDVCMGSGGGSTLPVLRDVGEGSHREHIYVCLISPHVNRITGSLAWNYPPVPKAAPVSFSRTSANHRSIDEEPWNWLRQTVHNRQDPPVPDRASVSVDGCIPNDIAEGL